MSAGRALTLIDMGSLVDIPGEMVEFGVYRGQTFNVLIDCAKELKKKLYGVDSFRGLAEPTEKDGAGGEFYPKGRFDVGGADEFIKIMYRNLGRKFRIDYEVIEGFIPEVLDKMPCEKFAYARVDLDHYKPVKAALDWVWPRLHEGGQVCCHDYMDKCDLAASLAIKEFLKERGSSAVIHRRDKIQLLLVKMLGGQK